MMIFTAILTATLLGVPHVSIISADTAGVDLFAWGDHEYNVYISHAARDCKWWPPFSKKVLTWTRFNRQTFRWADHDLDTPNASDEACIWWDAQPEPSSLYFGIERRNVKQKLYLPTVIKDV
jgi:hypothetical protein